MLYSAGVALTFTFSLQLSSSFDPSLIAPEPEPERKGSKRAEDIRPDVEVVAGDQDDERFWAKIPVIRDAKKKKRGGKPEPEVSKKKTKAGWDEML